MKRYVNKSVGMKSVSFSDGSGVYLRRGQSHESDKSVVYIDVGVVVEDVEVPTKKVSSKVE
jgi:hypothetical protein